jgi:hypothetical protein
MPWVPQQELEDNMEPKSAPLDTMWRKRVLLGTIGPNRAFIGVYVQHDTSYIGLISKATFESSVVSTFWNPMAV